MSDATIIYESTSSIKVIIDDSYEIGEYTLTIENQEGVSSTSTFNIIEPEIFPVPDYTLNPIYVDTNTFSTMTPSDIQGDYKIRIWNSERDNTSIPIESRYTDVPILFIEGGHFEPDDDNLDVTPIEYKLIVDPVTGQQYFTIIPSNTKPGNYNLRIHNSEGTGSALLVVTDSIGKPETSGIIIQRSGFNKEEDPEIISGSSAEIPDTYGYKDFTIQILDTQNIEPGTYMLSITNLSGRGN